MNRGSRNTGKRPRISSLYDNAVSQYEQKMIGICTTCLAETIGDDVSIFLNEYKKNRSDKSIPKLVQESTANYCGSYTDGFRKAVRSTRKTLAAKKESHEGINIFHLRI